MLQEIFIKFKTTMNRNLQFQRYFALICYQIFKMLPNITKYSLMLPKLHQRYQMSKNLWLPNLQKGDHLLPNATKCYVVSRFSPKCIILTIFNN